MIIHYNLLFFVMISDLNLYEWYHQQQCCRSSQKGCSSYYYSEMQLSSDTSLCFKSMSDDVCIPRRHAKECIFTFQSLQSATKEFGRVSKILSSLFINSSVSLSQTRWLLSLGNVVNLNSVLEQWPVALQLSYFTANVLDSSYPSNTRKVILQVLDSKFMQAQLEYLSSQLHRL